MAVTSPNPTVERCLPGPHNEETHDDCEAQAFRRWKCWGILWQIMRKCFEYGWDLVGGFNHHEKYESQLEWLFPYSMETYCETCSKPPPRNGWNMLESLLRCCRKIRDSWLVRVLWLKALLTTARNIWLRRGLTFKLQTNQHGDVTINNQARSSSNHIYNII